MPLVWLHLTQLGDSPGCTFTSDAGATFGIAIGRCAIAAPECGADDAVLLRRVVSELRSQLLVLEERPVLTRFWQFGCCIIWDAQVSSESEIAVEELFG